MIWAQGPWEKELGPTTEDTGTKAQEDHKCEACYSSVGMPRPALGSQLGREGLSQRLCGREDAGRQPGSLFRPGAPAARLAPEYQSFTATSWKCNPILTGMPAAWETLNFPWHLLMSCPETMPIYMT